jgi:hypothetical protein
MVIRKLQSNLRQAIRRIIPPYSQISEISEALRKRLNILCQDCNGFPA